MCSPLPRASLRAHGDTPGMGRECRRPAREGDAPATPLLLPPQLTTVRQSHLDALPRAPEPLTSCPLHILTWRERWGGIKEFVWNRFLCPVPRQDAHSAEFSTPLCPLPLTAPSARSKLPFPPPTANARITQDEGAELSLCPIPFPTSSPQIQAERRSPTRGAGSLRGSPALTVCRPAGPAASRPLAAPSGGPRPGPRGRSPRTDSPGPWCALFCGGQGSGPQARAPATRCRDKPCAGRSVGRSPWSSAGHLGSCVTCSPGSAPVSQASPSPELQRGRLGHRPRSAGESLGTGEENRCHQPCSARKEGHKGSSGRRLGRAGQAGRPQSLLLPERSPLASWFPGWDNPSPILHTQAETPARNKTPRTTGTELGKSSGAPVPNLSTSSLRGQEVESCRSPLGSCFGIFTNSPHSGGRCRRRRPRRPHTTWEPLTHRSPPGAAQTLSLAEAAEGKQNRERLSTGSPSPCSERGWKELGITAHVPEPPSSQRGEGALRSRTIAPRQFLQPER